MSLRISLILVFFSTFLAGCTERVYDDRMIEYSPSRRADIVYYFRKGTTNAQLNEFINKTLGVPHPGGGYSSLPGIQGDIYVITQGYEGYAITLRVNATDEQRQLILSLLKESPLIFKVFEDVSPNEIVLDPAIAKKEKEERDKATNDNRPTKTAVSTKSTVNNDQSK